jgi:hypothetical protein
MKMIAVHDPTGVHELKQGFLDAERPLPGLKLSPAEIFDDDLSK